MPQVAIYIDEALSKKLDQVTRASGKSKSKWVADVISEKLENEWPQDFFALAGTWEDDRSPEQIMGDIRSGSRNFEKREPLS